mgnify:FL=1
MITPARGYCLIEPLEAEDVSSGGVYLPERAKDMPQKGKILALGEQRYISNEHGAIVEYNPKDKLPDFKIGDTIIHKKFVDNRIKEDGKEYLFVKFEDILGTYE